MFVCPWASPLAGSGSACCCGSFRLAALGPGPACWVASVGPPPPREISPRLFIRGSSVACVFILVSPSASAGCRGSFKRARLGRASRGSLESSSAPDRLDLVGVSARARRFAAIFAPPFYSRFLGRLCVHSRSPFRLCWLPGLNQAAHCWAFRASPPVALGGLCSGSSVPSLRSRRRVGVPAAFRLASGAQ